MPCSADLPHFGTEGGFHQGENDRVTAPTLMFVEALDMVLGQMRDADFKFSSVSVQHHSTHIRQLGESLLSAGPFGYNDHRGNALWNEGSVSCC